MAKTAKASIDYSGFANRHGEPVTKRQKEIFEFILECIKENGVPPTVRDIGERCKIDSPNGVMCHLKALNRRGLIQWQNPDGPSRARSIKILAGEVCNCCNGLGRILPDEGKA